MNFRPSRHTAWRTLDDETIVLDLATRQLYGLNESAAFVWRALGAMEDFDVMLRAMTGPQGESPPFAAAELAAFCAELVALELLEEEVPDEAAPVSLEPLASLEPPKILWRETVEQVAASCAFMPAQNPLCNQVPQS